MTGVMVGRRERKKEETRRRIFESAVKLFTDKGFEATTTADIAAAADVSKGTFFNYFPRKDAIVRFLFEEWAERGRRLVAERDRSAQSRLVEVFVLAGESFGGSRELARSVTGLAAAELCGPPRGGVAAHRRHDQVVAAIWSQGVAKGELRSDVDAAQARVVLGAVFVGAVTWWIGATDVSADPQAMAGTLPDLIRLDMTLIFGGLRTS